MARALFPEEESAIDYKVVELVAPQRRRLNRNFLAAVLVCLLLMALGFSYIVARSAVASSLNLQPAHPQVSDTFSEDGKASDNDTERLLSYFQFKEPAPLDPIVPAPNHQHYNVDLPPPGNGSLYIEVHPGEYCLLVLSRKLLKEDELYDSSKIQTCYGRLQRNLRATNELFDVEIGILQKICGENPLVPVLQKCSPQS